MGLGSWLSGRGRRRPRHEVDVPLLVERLDSPVPDERADALTSLMGTEIEPDDEPAVVAAVRRVAVVDTDAMNRMFALNVLGHLGHLGDLADRDLVHPVLAVLRDPDPTLRMLAAGQASWFTGSEVVDALQVALQDPDPSVAAAAAESLGEIGDVRALPALESVASGRGDRSVRRAAGSAADRLRRA